jgi:hypothetical protein
VREEDITRRNVADVRSLLAAALHERIGRRAGVPGGVERDGDEDDGGEHRRRSQTVAAEGEREHRERDEDDASRAGEDRERGTPPNGAERRTVSARVWHTTRAARWWPFEARPTAAATEAAAPCSAAKISTTST